MDEGRARAYLKRISLDLDADLASAGIAAGFYLMPRCAWFSALADWYLGLG